MASWLMPGCPYPGTLSCVISWPSRFIRNPCAARVGPSFPHPPGDVVLDHALDHGRHLQPIAALNRQRFHLPPIEVARDPRLSRVDKRCFPGDGDGLLQHRNRHGQRDRGILPDKKLQGLYHRRRESRKLRLQRVASGGNTHEAIFAFGGRDIEKSPASRQTGGRHANTGKNGPGFVNDRPDYSRVLSRKRRCAEKKDETDDATATKNRNHIHLPPTVMMCPLYSSVALLPCRRNQRVTSHAMTLTRFLLRAASEPP